MREDEVKRTEEALVRRAASGDAEAFGHLYVRHLDAIYRYVFYKVGNEKKAEDLTEEVFLSAWEAMKDYEQRGHPFSAWLYRIAHNAVVDHYRTQKEESPLDPIAFTLADESLGPEEILVKKGEVSRLLAALTELSEEKRHLISEVACRVAQHRALVSLSEILETG